MASTGLRCIHGVTLRFARTDESEWCDVCDGPPLVYGPCRCGSNVAVAEGERCFSCSPPPAAANLDDVIEEAIHLLESALRDRADQDGEWGVGVEAALDVLRRRSVRIA